MNRFFILCLVALLFSCNGSTNFENAIENNSDKTVDFVLFNNGFPRDTITLEPSQNRVIRVGESSQADEEAPECARRIDSAHVIVQGGGTLLKDISDDDDWTVETEQTRNVPREFEHTCTFSFGNSDIED